jgi:hypothetical protein
VPSTPMAALVSADDLRPLNTLEERRQEQFTAIGRFSDAFGDVPIDDLERQVERVVAEARTELWAGEIVDSNDRVPPSRS